MKPRVGAPLVRMSPLPDGWRAQTASDSCAGATLGDLCEKLPSGLRAELLLPSSAIVMDCLTLPAAPREDLLSMAQLQLEKLLPYAADDFVFDIELLGGDAENVKVLALTAPFEEIKACAEPLRKAGLGPVAIGVYALQIARALVGKGTVMALWLEGGKPFLLLASEGKLLWLEGLSCEGSEPVASEISRVLLGAELSGILSEPVESVCLGAHEWSEAVREALPGKPVQPLHFEPTGEIAGNWLPTLWAEEASSLSKRAVLIERLQWCVIGYAALLAIGFCWLAFEKTRIARLDRQIAELQPQVELGKARQNRWRALEPAVEPSRYLIELLHQASKTVGGADIRITEFQMNPREFAISGEASNVDEAIKYVGRLKKEPELGAFKIDSPNPNILPNERAQFRVAGKVDKTLVKR